MNNNEYRFRHIGPRPNELDKMLKTVKAKSLNELIDQTVPAGIRLNEYSALSEPLSEYEYLKQLS